MLFTQWANHQFGPLGNRAHIECGYIGIIADVMTHDFNLTRA